MPHRGRSRHLGARRRSLRDRSRHLGARRRSLRGRSRAAILGRAAVPCGIVAAILGRAAIFGRALRALLQIDEHDEQHEQDQREHGEQDDQPQQRVDLFGDRPSEDDALREVFALFCRPRIVCRVGQREDDGIGALFIRDQPYLPVFELDARGGIYLHISAVVAENGDGDRLAVIHGGSLPHTFFAQRASL